MSGDVDGRIARFPRTGARLGYRRRQVDAFLDGAEERARAGNPLPAAEVRRVGFELVRNGYEPELVDRALDDLEERAVLAESGRPDVHGRHARVNPAADVVALRSMLDKPYAARFRRVVRARKGYDVDDVDDFLDRVLDMLAGGVPVTVAEVRAATFLRRHHGYDEEEVDGALDAVVEYLLRYPPG